MTKPTKKENPPEKSEGVRFREGYYEHHGLGEGRGCTREENDACMGIIRLILDGVLAECEGQERIKEILHPEIPF